MKLYKNDGKYSMGITVDEENRKDFEYLQTLIRNSVPVDQLKKFTTSLSPNDFSIISESDYGDKVWLKIYNL